MGDGHPFDQQQENSVGEDGQRLVTSEDYEVRIIEPAQPGGNWEAKAAIKMHMTENALTVRIVSIKVWSENLMMAAFRFSWSLQL